MKTIGIIGGMSWESSLEYYRIINETVQQELGGLHSAELLMYSYNFVEMEILQAEGKWEQAAESMVDVATRLERAGADFIVIATNTMHKLAPAIEEATSIPLLHIADAAARAIKQSGKQKVGLLGTKFTMEEDFYKERLLVKHGIEVVVPTKEQRQFVHDTIYNELCQGVITVAARERFKQIIIDLETRGAEGVVLGCTEIPLLIKQEDSSIPIFDTTTIHAKAAAQMSVS